MCRLACNVCGVTTVNGSSVGSSSYCRLSTMCSLSVICPDRPSTAGVLAFLWVLLVFCLDYHLPICVSVCVGHKRQFTTQFTTSSFCPEALLCFYCYTVSHRLASMGVRPAPTCLGEHTISPTASTTRVLAQGRDLARRVPAILIYNITNSVNDARASTGPRPRAARACNSIADAHRRDLVRGLDILQTSHLSKDTGKFSREGGYRDSRPKRPLGPGRVESITFVAGIHEDALQDCSTPPNGRHSDRHIVILPFEGQT